MTDPRQELGHRAEAWVADRLEHAGYTILARNWRHGKHGEIDLVARRDDEIVFIEVRARRGPLDAALEAARASVTPEKQARLLALAQAFLATHDLEEVPWRIDVAAVAAHGPTLSLEVIRDAVAW